MKLLKRISLSFSATVLTFAGILGLGLGGVAHAAGVTLYWCEANGGSFSTASNWNTDSNCTGGTTEAPVTGDALVFDNTNLTSNATINNDITGLDITSITFQGSGSLQYTITGDAMELDDGISAASGNFPTIDTDITLTADQAFTGDGSIFFGDSSNSPVLALGTHTLTIGSGSDTTNIQLDYGSSLTGSNAIDIDAGAGLNLLNTATNTFNGQIQDNGSLSLGSGSTDINSIIVDSSSSYALNLCDPNGATFPFNLTLEGDDAISTGPGCGFGGGGAPTFNTASSATLTGNIVLDANTTVNPEGDLTIKGGLSGAFTLTLDPSSVGGLIIDASSNTSLTPNNSYGSAATTAPASTTTTTSTKKAPGTPDTGSSLTSAKTGLTLLGTTIVAAGMYYASRKVRPSLATKKH